MIKAILAVDQAEVSGSAMGSLYEQAQLMSVTVGVAKSASDRARVIHGALAICDGDPSCLAVCFEDHGGFKFSRGNMSVRSAMGMGAARGRWLEALELAGVKSSKIFRVSPEVWRREVLGLSRTVKAERAKETAVLWARATLNRAEVDVDSAEALAILYWAARNIPRQIEANRATAAEARKRAKGAA